jgi:beta-phosphoglucomutase
MPFPGKQDYGRYIGRGDRECFAEVAREQGRELGPADMERLVALKAGAFVVEATSGRIKPYGGTVALLRAAAAVGPVGVCSGSIRASVEPVLAAMGLIELLSVMVTADDVVKNKPHPEPYLLAAARLGLEGAACIAVEDSPTGIKSARSAGYTVHAVCHSFERDRLGEAHRVHDSSEGMTLEHLLGEGIGRR